MARYAIRVEEVLARTIIVNDADSVEDAMCQVEEADIDLDYDDYCSRDLKPSEYFHCDGIDGLVPDDEDVSDYEHI